jgi:uncharacterized protein (UPF0276 family)
MKLGLAYRHQLPLEQSQAQHSLDCLEITADEVFDVSGARREQIERLRRTFMLLVNSLDLSIGSVERPPRAYLDSVARVLELTGAPYYSDHLAVTSTATRSLGQFSPVWYTEDMLDVVATNVTQVQRFTGLPRVL